MSELSTALSASRIKTAQSCSWLYWCKYKLKLPDSSNDGAKRGWICHLIFEVLGDTRRKKYYDKIMKTKDVFCIKSIEKLILKHASKMGVDDPENLELIREMTFNGLSYDFFGKQLGKPTVAVSEQDFEIVCDDGKFKYKIKGFIDKLFLYKSKKFALIRDFKTSKAVFKGSEITDNMQDLMYSLAVKKLFPEYENRQSEFLFLKFDLSEDNAEGVIKMKSINEEELNGFESQLTEIQKYLDNFSEKDAYSNFATKKGYPKDNTFGGKLLCGFASQKGELKKDGNPKWHCPMKFDFFYYHIKNSEGSVISSVTEEEFSEKLVPEGGSYEMKYYSGCPAHSS
jgi:hypothetical protein